MREAEDYICRSLLVNILLFMNVVKFDLLTGQCGQKTDKTDRASWSGCWAHFRLFVSLVWQSDLVYRIRLL